MPPLSGCLSNDGLRRCALALVALLAATGCNTTREISVDVVRMDRDGVDLHVRAFPSADVQANGMRLGIAPESGEVDGHVSLDDVHEGPTQAHVEISAVHDGTLGIERGRLDVALPMTVAAARAGAGHSARITVLSPPAGTESFPVHGALGEGAGSFGASGRFEVPFQAPAGTVVTSRTSSVTVDASGQAVLQLWLPEHFADRAFDSLHMTIHEAGIDVHLTMTSPNLDAGEGDLSIEVTPGRALRMALPFASATRPLFGAVPAPTPGRQMIVLADDTLVPEVIGLRLDEAAIVGVVDAGAPRFCSYTGQTFSGNLPYFGPQATLTAYDARSGAVAGTTTVSAPAHGCPESIGAGRRSVMDLPSPDELQTAMRALAPR